ncbi:conserved hypothetical protein [Tenacibaculum litopenaei]|uniref:hypothetical protein n=1 Tax=Tenacibaculum litopenaei TaxID=396016 RepID=UPI003895E3A8
MRILNVKKTVLSWVVLGMLSMVIVSCSSEDLVTPPDTSGTTGVEVESKTTVGKDVEMAAPISPPCNSLIDDGCSYTSGSGSPYVHQNNMISMMNQCRTEPLGNCNWAPGNTYVYREFWVEIKNCCTPAYALNAHMDGWKTKAQALRPGKGYIITGYTRVTGHFYNGGYSYRMKIRVQFRLTSMCWNLPDLGLTPIGG